jgi:hypothetical protein
MNYTKFLIQAEVPESQHVDALASLARAKSAAKRMRPYKWTAPIVMALVVPFLRWDAEKLPKLFAKWDNDISLNGDPWDWAQMPDGTWYRPAPLEDTPEARAACYWAKGHHPRSRWARYVWLGWRNRASKLAADLGVPATAASIQPHGDPTISKSKAGAAVYRMGDYWQIMSVEKVGPFAIRRNVGWKLNNVLHNQHTVANITWVPFSFPLWKD